MLRITPVECQGSQQQQRAYEEFRYAYSRKAHAVYVMLDISSVDNSNSLLGNSESTWLIGQSE